MTKATPNRAFLTGGILLGALLFAASSARADEPAEAGRFISVHHPIESAAVSRIKTHVDEAIRRAEGNKGFKVVFDFNPEGQANTADFGPADQLASYIRELRRHGVQAIAYVHGRVANHTVLPVLACEERVLSRSAEIGPINLDPTSVDDAPKRLAYDVFIQNRNISQAVVRKMYDKDVKLVRARPGPAGLVGDLFRDGRTEPNGDPVRGIKPDLPALYTAEQARDLGLCEQTFRDTPDEVRIAYRLPRSSMDPLPLIDRAPVAWLVAVSGQVNGELSEKVKRRVDRALGHRATLIVLQLECGDGDTESANYLANYLANLNENRRDNPVKTIAYVTPLARNTAAYLALACNQIVLHKDAKLGPFDDFLRTQTRDRRGTIPKQLADIARRQSYPEDVAAALADSTARLVWAEAKEGGIRRVMNKNRLTDDPEVRDRFKEVGGKAGMVHPIRAEDEDHCLTLDARDAVSLNIAREAVDGLPRLYEHEGVSAAQVTIAGTDWLDDLAEMLSTPTASFFLIMVGITCLILELKMPGVGLPGVTAAICFVLFFWSQSQLNGQITWLAILLFVLGLVLLALEIFILPGFGVCGISGLLLVIGSLGLMAYGHWPQTSEDWVGFGKAISPFGLSLLGAIVAAFILARFLPTIPFANRLMLKPPTEEEGIADVAPGGASGEFAALLGAIGVAATPLRPAGKVQFNEDFVDVVAEGGYIPSGTRVQVIEVEGNRVVVKEV